MVEGASGNALFTIPAAAADVPPYRWLNKNRLSSRILKSNWFQRDAMRKEVLTLTILLHDRFGQVAYF